MVAFEDVTAGDLTAVERRGIDLVLCYGASDRLTVKEQFHDWGLRIEQFRFSDGVVWDHTEIKARLSMIGRSCSDCMFGFSDANDRLYGRGGNDYLWGREGDDMLDGGDGDDELLGDRGADTLIGSVGDDRLYGGPGDDTYRFAAGAGSDRIFDEDYSRGSTDVAVFEGIAAVDVTAVERNGDDLMLCYGKSDRLRVASYFSDDANHKIEQFRFSDGVVWDDAAIKATVLTMGDANGNSLHSFPDENNRLFGLDGDDRLSGGPLADTLDGGSGDDRLHGNDGADTLIGAAGNDELYGGAGDDTYVFARGCGSDRIQEGDTTPGNTDVLMFGPDIGADQLWFRRIGEEWEVSVIGTADKVAMANLYTRGATPIEQLKLSDGRVLLGSRMQALVSAMSAFEPPSMGQTTLPPLYQATLAAVIASNWQ